MKLIDRTPLQDEKGEIGIIQRIQGTLKFGMSWYPELEAQKFVLARLERGLAKGYVVIRNHTLGASGIVVPLAIMGPAGVYVAYVTHLRGQYQAKGDSWGTLSGTTFKPASINLLTRTERLSRALQAYIERQGVRLPKIVEPILITANPGMHVESVRPLVRVVMADAIERWAASLSQSAPVLTVETAYELSDRIITPRKPKQESEHAEEALPTEQPESAGQYYYEGADEFSNPTDEAQTFDSNDLSFAYEEDQDNEVPSFLIEPSPSVAVPSRSGNKQKRYLGMTIPQLAILGGMFLVWICIMLSFAYIIFQNP